LDTFRQAWLGIKTNPKQLFRKRLCYNPASKYRAELPTTPTASTSTCSTIFRHVVAQPRWKHQDMKHSSSLAQLYIPISQSSLLACLHLGVFPNLFSCCISWGLGTYNRSGRSWSKSRQASKTCIFSLSGHKISLSSCYHPVSYEGVSERALYGRLYGHDGVLLCI
jgi:hypothetical protein